jgi:beta-lactam-binding protein with PASTA domain
MTANHSVNARFGRSLTPPQCVVPRLLGLSVSTARGKIHRAHCSVGTVTKTFSSARKNAKVVGQSPKAGKHLRNGAKVNLAVGKGPKR